MNRKSKLFFFNTEKKPNKLTQHVASVKIPPITMQPMSFKVNAANHLGAYQYAHLSQTIHISHLGSDGAGDANSAISGVMYSQRGCDLCFTAATVA